MDLGPKLATAFESGPNRSDTVMFVALLFAFVSYVFLTLDRRREGSPSRDDNQVGLKVLLFSALAVATLLAAEGARELLAFILGGFKGGWKAMRGPLAATLAGGGVAGAIYFLLLPRTNHTEKPQAERLAVGMVGVWLGGLALGALATFLEAVLSGSAWKTISEALATIGVAGGVGVLMILRLGALSGWRAMPRVPPMPMSPPMTGQPPGGYPPGSMPPLGGGYPPQGGWPQQ
jgi:hypothetical protein